MSSLALPAFNTLRYVKRLKEVDVPEKQGEASARVVAESDAKTQLAAATLEKKIEIGFADMQGELKRHHVLLGITLAGVGTIIGKLFWG